MSGPNGSPRASVKTREGCRKRALSASKGSHANGRPVRPSQLARTSPGAFQRHIPGEKGVRGKMMSGLFSDVEKTILRPFPPFSARDVSSRCALLRSRTLEESLDDPIVSIEKLCSVTEREDLRVR